MFKFIFLSTLILFVLLTRSILVAQCPSIHTFTGETNGDFHGFSVSGAGDLNNDGYADVIVGAERFYVHGPSTGKVYVYSGFDGSTLFTFTGSASYSFFGRSVSDAGDVNNDGIDDLIIGAPQYTGMSLYGSGKSYIYSGSDGSLLYTFIGENHGDRFGQSVSKAGDINNDGFADVIVGAPGNNHGGQYAGRAYTFYGGSGPFPVTIAASNANSIFTGHTTFETFGYSVSGAGDVDNDGYDDVFVGAYLNGSGTGKAYVFSGVDDSLLYTLSGETPNDMFGFSVSDAGDLNGDGFPDLIVGAWRNNTAGTFAGRAYAFYGKPGPFPITLSALNADLVFTGETAGNQFGSPVSGAGDVNGDSFDDIVVGADGYASWKGKVYIYSGKDGSLLSSLTGEATYDLFGVSVSDAGDVNKDGYADVIVGARQDLVGAGRAYVYSVANQTDVTGTVSSASVGLLGVPVDLYDSDNIVVSSAVTDELGEYQFTSLPDGDYTVSISTPLGYQADEETKEVSVPCGPASANFELTELDIIPQQRSRGYWKHQVSHVIKNIEHGDDKPTDYSAEEFMEFLSLTESHFVLNQIKSCSHL